MPSPCKVPLHVHSPEEKTTRSLAQESLLQKSCFAVSFRRFFSSGSGTVVFPVRVLMDLFETDLTLNFSPHLAEVDNTINSLTAERFCICLFALFQMRTTKWSFVPAIHQGRDQSQAWQRGRKALEPHNGAHPCTHARAGAGLAPASKVTTGRASGVETAALGMGSWPGIDPLSQEERVGKPLQTETSPSYSNPSPRGEQSRVEGL